MEERNNSKRYVNNLSTYNNWVILPTDGIGVLGYKCLNLNTVISYKLDNHIS